MVTTRGEVAGDIEDDERRADEQRWQREQDRVVAWLNRRERAHRSILYRFWLRLLQLIRGWDDLP